MVKAAVAYLEKNVRSLKEDNPGRAYKSLKKMSAQPGDVSDEGNFTLLSHMEENLSTEQSIERIAQYFSKISQEYPPLTLSSLPDKGAFKYYVILFWPILTSPPPPCDPM